jgi:hypothetical protein
MGMHGQQIHLPRRAGQALGGKGDDKSYDLVVADCDPGVLLTTAQQALYLLGTIGRFIERCLFYRQQPPGIGQGAVKRADQGFAILGHGAHYTSKPSHRQGRLPARAKTGIMGNDQQSMTKVGALEPVCGPLGFGVRREL